MFFFWIFKFEFAFCCLSFQLFNEFYLDNVSDPILLPNFCFSLLFQFIHSLNLIIIIGIKHQTAITFSYHQHYYFSIDIEKNCYLLVIHNSIVCLFVCVWPISLVIFFLSVLVSIYGKNVWFCFLFSIGGGDKFAKEYFKKKEAGYPD